ncbi:hypothetical protein MRX96_036761 [Rhipicephalus microplus]
MPQRCAGIDECRRKKAKRHSGIRRGPSGRYSEERVGEQLSFGALVTLPPLRDSKFFLSALLGRPLAIDSSCRAINGDAVYIRTAALCACSHCSSVTAVVVRKPHFKAAFAGAPFRSPTPSSLFPTDVPGSGKKGRANEETGPGRMAASLAIQASGSFALHLTGSRTNPIGRPHGADG